MFHDPRTKKLYTPLLVKSKSLSLFSGALFLFSWALELRLQ